MSEQERASRFTSRYTVPFPLLPIEPRNGPVLLGLAAGAELKTSVIIPWTKGIGYKESDPLNSDMAITMAFALIGANDLEIPPEHAEFVLTMAIAIYRFGMFTARAISIDNWPADGDITGNSNYSEIGEIAYNGLVQEYDDAGIATHYKTGWQKMVDLKLFITGDRDGNKRALLPCTKMENLSRAVFMLCATIVEWRSSNHHVGQGCWTGFCAKVAGFLLDIEKDNLNPSHPMYDVIWNFGHMVDTRGVLAELERAVAHNLEFLMK